MNNLEKIAYYNVIKLALLRVNPNIFNATQGMTTAEVNVEIAKAVSALKGEGLPENSDTLKELADQIVANQGGVNTTAVNQLIDDYATAHPHKTNEEINTLISEYATAHPSTNVTDEDINTLISKSMTIVAESPTYVIDLLNVSKAHTINGNYFRYNENVYSNHIQSQMGDFRTEDFTLFYEQQYSRESTLHSQEGYLLIFRYGSNNPTEFRTSMNIDYNKTKLQYQISLKNSDEGRTSNYDSEPIPEVGDKYTYAIVYNHADKTIKIYLNGVFLVENNNMDLTSLQVDFELNNLSSGDTSDFEVRRNAYYYNKAMTQAEIASIDLNAVTKSHYQATTEALIEKYAVAHPSTNVTDEHITELAKIYHDANQAGGGESIVVNPRAITIQDGLTEARVKELVAQHIASIPNAQKENSIVYKWNETRPATVGTNVLLSQEKDAGGSYVLGIDYASKKDWVFNVDHSSNTFKVYKGSDLSEVMTVDLAQFGADTKSYYLASTPDAKRVAIAQLQHGIVQILKLKDDLSGYEIESSIDTGGDSSIGDIALDGIGTTLATTTNIGKQLKIYSLNEQGTWNLVKTSNVVFESKGVDISKDGLEIYCATQDGIIRYINKVDGGWGDIQNLFTLPDGNGNYAGKSVALSLDKQVLYIGDGGYNERRGRVNVYYKQVDNTWQHKYDIHPNTVEGANTYFGIDVALNDDNSVVYIGEYSTHKIYKYDISAEVPTITLDANSLDPFNDGSLKSFYKFDGNLKDSIDLSRSTSGEGITTFASSKHGQGFQLNSEEVGNNSINLVAGTSSILKSNELTASIWITPTSEIFVDEAKAILSVNYDLVGVGNTYNSGWAILLKDGKIQVNYVLINTEEYTTTKGVTKNEVMATLEASHNNLTPVHIVVTRTGLNNMKLYVDGVFIDGVSTQQDSKYSQQYTTLASKKVKRNSNYIYSNGTTDILDHLQVFNRALTQEEVSKLYTAEVK